MRIPLLLGGAALTALTFGGAALADSGHGHAMDRPAAASGDDGRTHAMHVADATHHTIRIDGGFARQSIGMKGASGAFMTVHNGGQADDRLVGARSPVAGKAEVHRTTVTANGVAEMRPAGAIDLPAGGTIELQPGGLHIMLMQLNQALDPGAEIPLTLIFEKAGEVTVTIPVVAIGQGVAASGHMSHGSMGAGASGVNR